jgi:phosphoribosylformylglycinamidine cyclo-ligase
VDELGRTVGEELLVPTRIYARDCLALVDGVEVHAMSHVTGGGLANNLARVVPGSCTVTIDRATWSPAPVFGLVRDLGRVPQADLEATLNLGVGMVALVPETAVGAALDLLGARGLRSWVCGTVAPVGPDADPSGPRVELVGGYA